MLKFNTILVAIAATLSANAFAAKAEATYDRAVLMCDAGASFVRFAPAMAESTDLFLSSMGDVGCIVGLNPASAEVVAMTDKGVRFERVSQQSKRLVRVVAATGAVQGYAVYRGYMYPPQERAAVDVVLSRGEVK